MHCIRTILSIILIALAFASCQPSTPMPSTDEFIIWKGNLESAPDNPEAGWTYYNTTEGSTYIFLQDEWRRIASDGLDINWLGEYESAPVNPERNDAYFNSIDGNSYIFDGTEWDYLAKKGEDGTSGILKWYGERTSHISSPKDGDAYHNTIDSKSYIYYSGSWHVLSEDGEDGYAVVLQAVAGIEELSVRTDVYVGTAACSRGIGCDGLYRGQPSGFVGEGSDAPGQFADEVGVTSVRRERQVPGA